MSACPTCGSKDPAVRYPVSMSPTQGDLPVLNHCTNTYHDQRGPGIRVRLLDWEIPQDPEKP